MDYDFESDGKKLAKLRHQLHSLAEVSGEETNTSAFIVETLKSYDADDIMTDIGGHGVLARFDGDENEPVVMIRCELDALPIAEANDLDYSSQNEGVGHKCGHDGHMAILCGVAKWLNKSAATRGTVLLLFQPAEETGKGARKVLDDTNFEGIMPDYVFALHNIPGHKKHQLIVRNKTFAAASVGFIARLKGATAHAAHPEEGRSPALAVAQLIQSFSSVTQFHTPIEKDAKVTVIQAHLGEEAFGTSPGAGEVMATLRTYDDALLADLKEEVTAIAQHIADAYDLNLETVWVEPFPVTDNDPEAVKIIRSVADMHKIDLNEKKAPFGWSEDFGHFTNAFKGAMFGLGSGTDQPALHAPDYDFPDEIIPTGVKIFTGIIQSVNCEG